MPSSSVSFYKLGGSSALDGLTNLNRFSFFTMDPARVAANIATIRAANSKAKILVYVTASDMEDLGIGAANPTTAQERTVNYGSVTYNESLLHDQTAAANDKWVLRTSGGLAVQMYGYGFYNGDVGLQSFRDRWWQIVLDKVQFLGCDGIHIDNLMAHGPFEPQSGAAVFPSKYPDDASWEEAMYAFIVDIGARCAAAGFYCKANAGKVIPASRPGYLLTNDNTNTKNWWARIAPNLNGLMNEYWSQPAGDVTYRRRTNAFWEDYFEQFTQQLEAISDAGGCDLFAHTVTNTVDSQMALYGRAAQLLFWNGVSGATFEWNLQLPQDQFSALADVDIGAPTGAATTPQTNLYVRYFTNGCVILNSDPTAQGTTAKTVTALDGRTYTKGDGSAQALPISMLPGTAVILYTAQGTSPPPPPNTTGGTFGRTTIGGSMLPENGGLLAAQMVTLPADGTITKLTAYLSGQAGGAGTQRVKAVLYADSSGAPGAKLAEGSDVTIANGQAAGWVDLPFGTPYAAAQGTIWITLAFEAGSSGTIIDIGTDATGGVRAYKVAATYASLPSPFGAPDATDTANPSVYATYTVPVASTAKVGTQTIGSTKAGLAADTKRATKIMMPVAANITKLTAYVEAGPGTGAAGTFGKTAVGTTQLFTAADSIRVTSFTLAAAATVSKLTAYMRNLSATIPQQVRGVIYNSAAGLPTSLAGATNGITIVANQAPGWVDLVFATPISLPAGTYFLGIHGGPTDSTGAIDLDAAGGSSKYRFAEPYGSGPSNPFSTPDASDSDIYAIYATYTLDTSATQNAKAVIYADNGGVPGALLGTSAQVALTTGAAAAWVDFAFATPVGVNAGAVWIGLITDATANVIRLYQDLTGGAVYTNADVYVGGAANPYGTATLSAVVPSLYATYTVPVTKRPPGPRKTRARLSIGWPTE